MIPRGTFSVPPPTTALQSGFISRRIHFQDLNFDVLAQVFDALSRSSYWSPNDTYFRRKTSNTPLLPLSETCRALREALSPHLFGNVRWPRKHPREKSTGNSDSVIPDAILHHIRHLIVSCEHVDVLLSYLRKMNSLLHVTFDVKYTPSEAVVNTIARLPSLVAWDLYQTPLNFHLHSFVIPSLRRLSIQRATKSICVNGGRMAEFAIAPSSLDNTPDPGGALFRIHVADIEHNSYLATSTSLFTANFALLQHVEADSSLFPWGLLGTVEWPNLRVLIFTGDPPLDKDVPFLMLLGGMPSLEDLRLLWSPGRLRKFEAIPRNLLDFESGRTFASSFPSLHSFTLSNPLPQDLIFSLFPHSVGHIFLPAIHREDMTDIVPSAMAVDMVRAIKRRKHTISSLQLIVQDMPSLSLIQFIASSFPVLRNLELGTMSGLYSVSPDVEHNLDSYADALAPLAHLETLRITLPFPGNSRSNVFMGDQKEALFAAGLAARFPELSEVAFQSIHCVGREGSGNGDGRYIAWESYGVIRGGSNGVVVVWDNPSR